MGMASSMRAEVVRGLEPLQNFHCPHVRQCFGLYEEHCPCPALWERGFFELLGCFATPEACARAFAVLDTDGNGFIDARELFGCLAVISKGHLSDRMLLLFDIFDLNQEREMSFDECFLMLRRTIGGLRKMVGILTPPEKVILCMVRQIWKEASKHRDTRITAEDWHNWWTRDSSARGALKSFTWKQEEHRGLPTPDTWHNVDYTRGGDDDLGDKVKSRLGHSSSRLTPGEKVQRRASEGASATESGARDMRRTASKA